MSAHTGEEAAGAADDGLSDEVATGDGATADAAPGPTVSRAADDDRPPTGTAQSASASPSSIP